MKNLILLLLSLTSVTLAQVLSFDCAVMPGVCTNMCWGVHCTGGRWSVALTYSSSKGAPGARRRRSAGCAPWPNRCSPTSGYAPGFSCDEFPFASNLESDRGGQGNRCVPKAENSQQGKDIATMVFGKPAGYKYSIAFLNPRAAGVKYCTNTGAGVCTNDGNQWIKGTRAPNPTTWTPKLKRRDEIPEMQPTYLYKVSSGRELSSPELLEIGQEINTVVARNVTLAEEILAGRADEDLDNSMLATETIVERLE